MFRCLTGDRSCAVVFFFQAEDCIRDADVTGVQTCALPISNRTYSASPAVVTPKTVPSTLSYTVTYAGSKFAPTSVGDYPIVAKSTDPRYTVTANAVLKVLPAPLTARAGDASCTFGSCTQALSHLAGHVTGVKGADKIMASYTTTAKASSNAGTYVVTPAVSDGGSGTLKNYRVKLVTGVLTIEPAPTRLDYTGPAKLRRGKPAVLSASLVATLTGKPVAGRSLTIILGSGSTKQTCTTKPTNPAGTASCTLARVTGHVGSEYLTLTFKGDTKGPRYQYLPASKSTKLSISS